jgi:hypothetical protein
MHTYVYVWVSVSTCVDNALESTLVFGRYQARILTYLLNYLLTYLLTPWCRILFEKLIVTQLVKNILLSYGPLRFITVFTQARH